MYRHVTESSSLESHQRVLAVGKKGDVVAGADVRRRRATQGVWEVTAWVLLIFFECSWDRSSMFWKFMLPPKFSW